MYFLKSLYRYVKLKSVLVLSSVVWLVLIVYNFPSLYFHNLVELSFMNKKFCYFEQWSLFFVSNSNYQVFGMVLFYMIPIMIMATTCILLANRIKTNTGESTFCTEISTISDDDDIPNVLYCKNEMNGAIRFTEYNRLNPKNTSSAAKIQVDKLRTKRNYLKMVFCILFCFLFINMPFYTQLIIQTYGLIPTVEDSYSFKVFVLVSILFYFLNSPVNCFIYYHFNRRLNKSIKTSLRRFGTSLRATTRTTIE